MFDSIDMSDIYNMESNDTFDVDSGIDDTPITTETVVCTESTNEDSSSEELFGETDNKSFETTSETLDTYPWNSENNDSIGAETQLNSQTSNSSQIDLSQLENELSFKGSGYTQSEINSHISKAKIDIADAESDIRHHTSIANSKARMGEPHSFEDSQIRSDQARLNEAKSELWKWQHTKPSK